MQIVSSAIGYNPPGNPITAVLDRYAGNKANAITKHGSKDGSADGQLYETAAWLFKDNGTRPSISPRFANRNNFVEFKVRALPMAADKWNVCVCCLCIPSVRASALPERSPSCSHNCMMPDC